MSGFFFFNDTATTEIYTLSLHDALPIWLAQWHSGSVCTFRSQVWTDVLLDKPSCGRYPTYKVEEDWHRCQLRADRKSTRLNSSHANISYAVFCLKKKNLTDHLTLIFTYV